MFKQISRKFLTLILCCSLCILNTPYISKANEALETSEESENYDEEETTDSSELLIDENASASDTETESNTSEEETDNNDEETDSSEEDAQTNESEEETADQDEEKENVEDTADQDEEKENVEDTESEDANYGESDNETELVTNLTAYSDGYTVSISDYENAGIPDGSTLTLSVESGVVPDEAEDFISGDFYGVNVLSLFVFDSDGSDVDLPENITVNISSSISIDEEETIYVFQYDQNESIGLLYSTDSETEYSFSASSPLTFYIVKETSISEEAEENSSVSAFNPSTTVTYDEVTYNVVASGYDENDEYLYGGSVYAYAVDIDEDAESAALAAMQEVDEEADSVSSTVFIYAELQNVTFLSVDMTITVSRADGLPIVEVSDGDTAYTISETDGVYSVSAVSEDIYSFSFVIQKDDEVSTVAAGDGGGSSGGGAGGGSSGNSGNDSGSGSEDDDYEEGHYYHIDIRIDGGFTYVCSYIYSDEIQEANITKSWDDSVYSFDHETVTVYLIDSNGEYVTYTETGELVTIVLTEDSDWSDVIDVSEISGWSIDSLEEITDIEEIGNYDYEYTITTTTVEENSTDSYEYEGYIIVESIDSVSYINEDGDIVELDVSLYEETEDGDDTEYEFIYDNGNTAEGRRLTDLVSDSIIYVTVTYYYYYIDENGDVQEGTNTETFSFTAGDDNNDCSKKDAESTEAGYDAVIDVSSEHSTEVELADEMYIDITNYIKTYLVTVVKQVEGGDTSESFDFSMLLTRDGEALTETISSDSVDALYSDDGTYSFSLTDGESISFIVPSGTLVEVTEDSGSYYTYVTSTVDEAQYSSTYYSVEINSDTGEVTITYVNTLDMEVEVGESLSEKIPKTIIFLLVLSLIFYLSFKRKGIAQ